jgi:hypothetical protein
MKKTTYGVLVLVLLLALLLGAAPALAADYPAEYVPGTAYIHPYDGDTWGYWEECAWDGTCNGWDIDRTPNWWAPKLPYKAIPADYKVYFAAIFQATPRGQVASLPNEFQFDFTIGDRHVTAQEAKLYWSAPMQIETWEGPTVYSPDTPVLTWEIGWLFPVDVSPRTTYSGTMSYVQTVPMIDLTLWDPTQTKPSHVSTYSSSAPYSFTIARR